MKPLISDKDGQMIAFGPVPSRRLGRSLGINNIPPKTCSYSCVYCQLGRPTKMQIERLGFYPPQRIFREVLRRVDEAWQTGEAIDYLTFVSDGEPTLDIRLGEAIDRLRPLGKKIAVISNASLLWRTDVRNDLTGADWVSAYHRLWRLRCSVRQDRRHCVLMIRRNLRRFRTRKWAGLENF